MRVRYYIFAIAMLLLPVSSHAKETVRLQYSDKSQNSRLVRKYTELLHNKLDSIYSDSTVPVSRFKDIDTAPFFLPFTYYRSIAHDAFSMSKDLTPPEKQLLSVYLSHPELVVNTQHHLDVTGPAIEPKTITDTPTEIVKTSRPQEPEPLPVDVIVLKPDFWTYSGDYSLQFIQNYLTDNWYQGGESNYSMLGSVRLSANYNNKQKVKWDNTLEMKFGTQTAKSDTVHNVHPTEDMIRYTGKIGLQASRRWYYTFQLIGQTQFARHYKTNTGEVQSDFFSPINVNASIGMDYNIKWLKNKITGSIHLAPLAYNFKYVGRLGLAARNGIDKDHHALNDFGSQITLNFNWKISENVSWRSRVYWYTTYERTEAEWENTLSFQFNRYLATKVFLYPRFDDDRKRDDKLGYWMFKEYISLGFSYSM